MKSHKAGVRSKKRKKLFIILLALCLPLLLIVCLMVGSSDISLIESIKALFGRSTPVNNRIMLNIRLPRIIAAIAAGAGLSLSGLIMQTVLGNSMASPSTLGVSNAASFGANISIIVSAGGFLGIGNNLSSYAFGSNAYATSFSAFIFSFLSVLLILGLCKIRSFSPNVVVLAGIALGSVWTAMTTLLQFFATDVGLSAAVLWSFGDLSRATYESDFIMIFAVLAGFIFFMLMSMRYNALLSGDTSALTMGVNIKKLRFISLIIASLITAICVSFLGIIGFIGIICPHIAKRIVGEDHRYSIPASLLSGSMLLLAADTLSRFLGNGTALPVGALTTLLGAPFFIYLIIGKRRSLYADC